MSAPLDLDAIRARVDEPFYGCMFAGPDWPSDALAAKDRARDDVVALLAEVERLQSIVAALPSHAAVVYRRDARVGGGGA